MRQKNNEIEKKKYWGRDGVMMMILIRETLLYISIKLVVRM